MHRSRFATSIKRLSVFLGCWALLSSAQVLAEDGQAGTVDLHKQTPHLDSVKKSETKEEKTEKTEVPGAQKANDLLRQGTLHHNNGYLAEAEQCFRQALILDPRNANGYFNLGAIAESRGDLITALGHYRAGLNVSPGDKEINDAIASVESQLKQVGSSESSSARLARSTATFLQPVSDTAPPILSSPAPPVAPARAANVPPSSKQFQLKSSTSRMTGGMQATAPSTPPVASVTQPSRKKAMAKAALGAAVSIGLSTALRSSGLHCPVCRVVRFGF